MQIRSISSYKFAANEEVSLANFNARNIINHYHQQNHRDRSDGFTHSHKNKFLVLRILHKKLRDIKKNLAHLVALHKKLDAKQPNFEQNKQNLIAKVTEIKREILTLRANIPDYKATASSEQEAFKIEKQINRLIAELEININKHGEFERIQLPESEFEEKTFTFYLKKQLFSQPVTISEKATNIIHYFFYDQESKTVFRLSVSDPCLNNLIEQQKFLTQEFKKREARKAHSHETRLIFENLSKRNEYWFQLRNSRATGLRQDITNILRTELCTHFKSEETSKFVCKVEGILNLFDVNDRAFLEINEIRSAYPDMVMPKKTKVYYEDLLTEFNAREKITQSMVTAANLLIEKENVWQQIQALTYKGTNKENQYYFDSLVSQHQELEKQLAQARENADTLFSYANNDQAIQIKKLESMREQAWLEIEALIKNGINNENINRYDELAQMHDELTEQIAELKADQEKNEVVGTEGCIEVEAGIQEKNNEASDEALLPDDVADPEPRLIKLFKELDTLNDNIKLVELKALLYKRPDDVANFKEMDAQRDKIKAEIDKEKQLLQEQADAEEARLEEEKEEKEEQERQALLANIEEQLEQSPDINKLIEKTETLDAPVVNNLFGNQHNFFKPKPTLWEKFCNFFRRLFSCWRPPVEDEEVQYQRLRSS